MLARLASLPTGRTRRTPHLPPTIIHALSNDRKKEAQHTSGKTDRQRHAEGAPQIMGFYGRMPFLPPTHQLMSAVVGLRIQFYVIARTYHVAK